MEPASHEQIVAIIRQRADRLRDAEVRLRDVRLRNVRFRELMRIRDNRAGQNIEPALRLPDVNHLPVNGQQEVNLDQRRRRNRDAARQAYEARVDVLNGVVAGIGPVAVPVVRQQAPPVPPHAALGGGMINHEQPQELAPRQIDPLGVLQQGNGMFLGDRNGRRLEHLNQRMQEIERDHADRLGRANVAGFDGLILEDARGIRRVQGGPQRADQPPLFRQATIPSDEDDCSSQIARTTINMSVEGDVITYASSPDQPSSVGLFIWGKCLKPETNYFEIEILDRGLGGVHNISIGVVNLQFPLDTHIGRAHDSESIAYHTGEGALYHNGPRGQSFGDRCEIGDKIGCGIRFPPGMKHSSAVSGSGPDGGPVFIQVFFTRNGKEIPSDGHNMLIALPPHGFFSAISMNQSGEEVCVKLPGSGVRWAPEEDIMMLVDSAEDDWLRLHDIRLNGPMLEYIGRGKSLVDVGLAQAKTPICTRNHYFEIEIVDPGSSCFIAIGLARKDYPKNRHPGWNKGSIAYHADDGKVFVGSGVGAPFGPRCHKGDVMGCGVLFPRNYECKSDSEEELEQQGGVDQYGARAGVVPDAVVGEVPNRLQPGGPEAGGVVIGHNYVQLDYASDSGEDDDWWNDRNYIQSGVKVEIYFTRNGNVIGKKEIRIPKGGFYPTVGMMSCDEKVRVDLRPLSG